MGSRESDTTELSTQRAKTSLRLQEALFQRADSFGLEEPVREIKIRRAGKPPVFPEVRFPSPADGGESAFPERLEQHAHFPFLSLFKVAVWLTYSTILVSGVQHSHSMFSFFSTPRLR